MAKIFTDGSDMGIRVSDHVTPWLTMRDNTKQLLFENFKRANTNTTVLVILQILITLYTPFEKLTTYHYYPTPMTLINCIFGIISPVFSGWVLVYIYLRGRYCKKSNSNGMFGIPTVYFESFQLIGVCISFSLAILVIGDNGPCKSNGFDAQQGCGYSAIHQMPEDMMMISAILPGFLAVVIKGIKFQYVVVGFLIVVAANLYTMFAYDLTNSFYSFLFYLPICGLLIYENQRQDVAVFLLSQSQENLLKENERLAAETHANELRHMIGNVAHDLKTPLSAFVSGMDLIVSLLSELRADTTISSDSETKVASIGESIDNMKNVNAFMLMTINRCIDYTKASNGLKLVPRLETVNFADTLALPLNCMKNLQNSNIEIKLLPISDKIAANIITDKQWLQENILCLLSNAVKYSAGGVVTILASISDHSHIQSSSDSMTTIGSALMATDNCHTIRIEVEDTGIGISEENMVNLFNPFKQAQRLAGGTGLGLYSLAKRIEALNGSYGIKKRPDGKQGSLFWFTIPYRPDCSAITIPESHLGNKQAKTTPTSMNNKLSQSQDGVNNCRSEDSLRILLVDDAISILKMSSKMLRRQGHIVITAENGAQALQILSDQLYRISNGTSAEVEERFDVVLMDLQMPIMDGLEATSRLRKMELTYQPQPETQSQLHTTGSSKSARQYITEDCSPCESKAYHQMIVGVSANSDNETVKAAYAAGVDAFIPKPFSLQSFNETISKLKSERKDDIYHQQ